MGPSGAVYDLLVAALHSAPLDRGVLRRASAVPLPIWGRVLGFEGCAPQIDVRLRARGDDRALPEAVRRLLRDATASSVRLGLLAYRQLTELAALTAGSGIRIMVLKGAAQLLGGLTPGSRSISDIDVLVMPGDATRLRALLLSELGYASAGLTYPHHLPVLTRQGSLNIDLHVRLSDVPVTLDDAIWNETRLVTAGEHRLELPSSTNMVLHALEHGLGLNWMGRYRLRDVLDVMALCTDDVSTDEVRRYASRHSARVACETLLSAAHELEPRVPGFRVGAWRTIRRVSRTRLALATLPKNPRVAERWFRYAGLLAEGSPSSLVRAGRSAVGRLVTAVTSPVPTSRRMA
jgi:hypothetical protein